MMVIDIDEFAVRSIQRELPNEVLEFVDVLRRTREDVYYHSVHVAMVCRRLARAMCLSQEDTMTIMVAAYLHDIGKVFIPERVLYKPELHDHEERSIMRQHAFVGETCLAPFGNLQDIARIVGQHHERIDGKGYPRGLSGDEIDPRARLLSIADAATAMIEDRPYQASRSADAAVLEIRCCAGRHFDQGGAHAMRAEFLFR